MIILVSGATATFSRYSHTGRFGRLLTPSNRNSVEKISSCGFHWACDNDCGPRKSGGSAFDPAKFRRMLHRVSSVSLDKFLWVACPDVVGNAKETIERFDVWQPEISALGLPVAFVGQDGAETAEIPWDRFSTFFVGGSTEWKLSKSADDLAIEAKRRNKWVHYGRVQTLKRIKHIHWIGCVDSFDGTRFSKWPDQSFGLVTRWMDRLDKSSGYLFK